MKIPKTLGAVALALGLSLSVGSVHAMHVYDSSNFTQNYTTAINAIKSAQAEIDQLAQMKTATVNLVNSTASLANLPSLAGTSTEITLFNQLKNVDTQLMNSVSNSMKLNSTLLSRWGSSNMSFESFCTSLANSSQARATNLLSLFQTSTAEMQQVAARRQQIINQLGTAVGQTQAIQAVGAAIDVLVGQNQQIIGLMTAQGADTVAERNDQESTEKFTKESIRQYQERKRNASQAFH